MKKIIFCLIMAVIFYGCVTTPPRSDGSMSESERCVYECEMRYEQCKLGCMESLDGFAEAGGQEQCKFNCKKDLNECYEVCKEN